MGPWGLLCPDFGSAPQIWEPCWSADCMCTLYLQSILIGRFPNLKLWATSGPQHRTQRRPWPEVFASEWPLPESEWAMTALSLKLHAGCEWLYPESEALSHLSFPTATGQKCSSLSCCQNLSGPTTALCAEPHAGCEWLYPESEPPAMTDDGALVAWCHPPCHPLLPPCLLVVQARI